MGVQALPKTIYLWLALLVASILIGNRLESRSASLTPRVRAGLSGPSFEDYEKAERLTRSHYALSALGGGDTLSEAQTLYQRLAKNTGQPNPARKALILGHQLKQPLDEATLKQLPEKEHALWRALYGASPTPLPADAEAQLKAMQLRFLDNQALADLYQKQGNTKAARAAEARRDEQAQGTILRRFIPLLLLTILGGVVGLGLLLFAGFVAVRREWHLLGRVTEPSEPKLGWGDLLDGFVFYLGVYRAVGLLVALTLSSRSSLVPLQIVVQFLTGFTAMAYLAAKARKRGTALAELGWSRERLGGNVLYGVGGYLATLPLMALLSLLSRQLFEHNTNTTPNPAMTLLSGRNSAWELSLLFVTISVGAPLFEEFFFRGALFTALRRRFAGLPSIVLSACVFAAVHPVQDWLPIIGLGFSFATMRHLRQSLVPGMVAHFLQNTASFLFLRAIFGE